LKKVSSAADQLRNYTKQSYSHEEILVGRLTPAEARPLGLRGWLDAPAGIQPPQRHSLVHFAHRVGNGYSLVSQDGSPGTMSSELQFHEFEHQGWEEVARRYDESWALVTVQSIRPLLDAAHVGRGTRELDVACGPGYVVYSSCPL